MSEDEKREQKANRQMAVVRTLLGCFGGLILALAAWGLDGNTIRQAHGILPWMKLATGILIAIPLYSLGGYLSGCFGTKYYFSFISFAACGFIIAWVAAHLSYDWYASLLKIFSPDFSIPVNYVFDDTAQTRFTMTAIILIIFSALFAFFYETLVVQMYSALSTMSVILVLVVFGLFFFANGLIIDHFNNSAFRQPLIRTDYFINRAAAIQRGELANDPKKTSWERTFLFLDIDLNVPRRLFTASLEPSLATAHVRVLFDTEWYDCVVVEEQPYTCESLQ